LPRAQEIEHLPVDKLYWADLDAKQQAAAQHFGYTKATWDETWSEADFNPSNSGKPSAAPAKPSAAAAAAPTADKPDKKTNTFTPPPKGKVFAPLPKKEDDKDEKKEDDDHKFIKPFKKLFGKLRD
jgi:hypothetical protein